MITAEGITMKYSHFRLKVDLSKFFHDVRQFCWIFIDGTKIQQVIHIKQHIAKLFNIAEPFHLLLNETEYLPPTEDVRILKENETILVVPGSGINDEVAVVEIRNDSDHDKEAHKINVKTTMVAHDTLNISNNLLNDKRSTSIGNTTRDMTFYSVIDDTVINDTEEETDSKVTDNNLTEDCNITNSIVPKRKRVRKRRPKNRSQLLSPPDTNEEHTLKKPKVIDSYVIRPAGKHIRFDNTESDKNVWYDSIVEDVKPMIKASSCRDLNTLLALGQTSTPLTFMNKKINEVKAAKVSIDKIGSNSLTKIIADPISAEKSKEVNKKLQSYKTLRIDLEEFPIMTRKPEIKDIIAFKTLKIGADYSPQESNFILTEVVDLCVQSANYTLKILYGKEEVQVPFGKFRISEDESANQQEADTFILNYSQMRGPRLIPPSCFVE